MTRIVPPQWSIIPPLLTLGIGSRSTANFFHCISLRPVVSLVFLISQVMRDLSSIAHKYMVAFDSDYTAKFYYAYGDMEWDRLEVTPYGRLQATIHAEFIERYVRSGDRVLDAGCGPGRFTTIAAQLGATVTALDASERQLELAKEKIGETKMPDGVDALA